MGRLVDLLLDLLILICTRYFLKALALRPDDEDIGRELAMIDRQLKIEQDNERALCRRMFENQVIVLFQ